jgi:lipoprotein-anchoring transpeptidase ErfK/SrfK
MTGSSPGRYAAGLVALALSVLATACTASTGTHREPAGGARFKPPAPGLVLAPAADATGVPVTDPVTVHAVSAVVDTVTMTDADGRQVPGEFDAARRIWHSTAPLAYGERYTVTAAGTGSNRAALIRSASFTTVKPARLTGVTLRANKDLLLTDRPAYGVGQPIVVNFDEAVSDRAAAEKSLQVITTPHVDGAWHWFGDQEAHWRPQQYWKPGTKVTVNANLYGTNLGDGSYGQGNTSASFTIGPSKIAIADDATYHMKAFIDGQEVRDIPIAMGRHELIGSIDLHTRSGPHIVLGNDRVTRMTSASFGLTGAGSYDAMVEWTTHISYEGEYVHAAPWSVGQQGNSDASHGCININTDNAIWFYNTFGPGDVVDVRNTGVPLDSTDGLGDWTLSWADWLKGSAGGGGAPSGGTVNGGAPQPN